LRDDAHGDEGMGFQGASETEIQVSGGAPLRDLRPKPRGVSEVQDLSDLLPDPRQRGPDSGCEEGELVDAMRERMQNHVE